MRIDRLVNTLLESGAHRATAYVSPKMIIRATRRIFGGTLDKRTKTQEVALTIGRPNYRERAFIKKCKAAGEPFPVRKPQLQFLKAA